jgi:hypothetical protein
VAERTVAALFVAPDGPYYSLPGVEPWGPERDARTYAGPHPVVAHPPCERWGRYWGGGPSARVKRKLGDDGYCFVAALTSVEQWGGVLEHPEASHAWARYKIPRPSWREGWVPARDGWTCCVAQGNYGHRARKLTWLYYVGNRRPLELDWSIPTMERLDEGFHSREERNAARRAGQPPRPRLSKRENELTPLPFRDILLKLARRS